LTTIVLPQASAGPTFQLAIASGKFHRDDQPDDAERLAERQIDAAGHWNRLAVVLVDRPGVEVEDFGDHADLAAGVGDRLARVTALQPSQLLTVLLDEEDGHDRSAR
jgi:hypothetical protein